MDIFIILLKIALVFVCLLIVLLVLMQRPKQEGLGAAFAQGMMNEIGGAQTANILQKGTTYLGVMFFGISLLLAVLISRDARTGQLGKEALESIGDKSAPGTAGEPTIPLNFGDPVPGVDGPLGGTAPGGTTSPEGGTPPEGGGASTPDPGGETPETPVVPEGGTTPEAPDVPVVPAPDPVVPAPGAGGPPE